MTVCLPVVHSFHLRHASKLFCLIYVIKQHCVHACIEGVICVGVYVASYLQAFQAYDWAVLKSSWIVKGIFLCRSKDYEGSLGSSGIFMQDSSQKK